MTQGGAPARRWPLMLAFTLSVVLVAGVLAAAAVLRGQGTGPLALDQVAVPGARSPDCARLLSRLPTTLDGGAAGALDRRQLAPPAPPATVAWGAPPVLLRCGVSRPAGLTVSSRLLVVSGVQFLEVPGPAPDTDTWVAVDRPVYVAVTLPSGSGSAPLQQLTEAIGAVLPARPLDLAG